MGDKRSEQYNIGILLGVKGLELLMNTDDLGINGTWAYTFYNVLLLSISLSFQRKVSFKHLVDHEKP